MPVAVKELLLQKLRAKEEQFSRNRKRVEQGILSDGKFSTVAKAIQQNGFQDVLKTTLGTAYSKQGLLRNITHEDLIEFDRKINALQGKYQGGIKPSFVINASLPIDRQRASKEIPWSHPISSRYLPNRKSLVVSFTTAASGKNQESKHYVNVEFTQFKEIITHRLMLEPNKEQATADIKALQDSLIKFDCSCGRHTYWYRYIASTGKFAYVGSNPIGREEIGFPKIRNPQLKGLACKHVLRTMQTILKERSFQQFMLKAIMKHYKNLDTTKAITTQTTKREMEASIKRQHKAEKGILSDKEKNIAPELWKRYQNMLANGRMMRSPKDKRTKEEKLALLNKFNSMS